MTQVLATSKKLTGKFKITPGIFSPTLWVEEEIYSFDTNSGIDEPPTRQYRKASNKDMFEINFNADSKNKT